MPLYLEDIAPNAWPGLNRQVLAAMAGQVGQRPINPGMAMVLIRNLVGPLLPASQLALLKLDGQPSWERIHRLCSGLASADRVGQEAGFLAAAGTIRILLQHSTRPPREFAAPSSPELDSFARHCGCLGVPHLAPKVKFNGQVLDLHGFCKYCWLPCVSRGVCRLHSTKPTTQILMRGHPACSAASLKQASRLQASFMARLHSISAMDEATVSGTDVFLLPRSGTKAWLAARRPTLGRQLGAPQGGSNEDPLGDLLLGLYGAMGPAVANVIGDATQLLTPVTTRAEAWLDAWEARPTWGGSRRRGGKHQSSRHQRRLTALCDIDVPVAKDEENRLVDSWTSRFN